MNMIVAFISGVSGGAILAVAWERYRRPYGSPPKPVSDKRMATLHVIDGGER